MFKIGNIQNKKFRFIGKVKFKLQDKKQGNSICKKRFRFDLNYVFMLFQVY